MRRYAASTLAAVMICVTLLSITATSATEGQTDTYPEAGTIEENEKTEGTEKTEGNPKNEGSETTEANGGSEGSPATEETQETDSPEETEGNTETEGTPCPFELYESPEGSAIPDMDIVLLGIKEDISVIRGQAEIASAVFSLVVAIVVVFLFFWWFYKTFLF